MDEQYGLYLQQTVKKPNELFSLNNEKEEGNDAGIDL